MNCLREFNEMEIRDAEKSLEIFLDLPDKAQSIFLVYATNHSLNVIGWKYHLSPFRRCESEIEKIFYAALLCYADPSITNDGLRSRILINCIRSQVPLMCEHKYRADFYFCSDDFTFDGELESFELVIECDGHDYHSSKEQIKHDNERDMELKLAGYDVIHFSGSQIYNDPYKTAQSAINYIESKLKPIRRKEGENVGCKVD